jgi:alkanesulfonate monooxygenase SsuD/methylene tetrahydromethanopterin reductase-like flavin-dependent oxidoreductase (luciferase family)
MGGNTAESAERAASCADGWIPWELKPERFRERVARARQARQRAGRTAALEVVAPFHVGGAETAEHLAERLLAWQAAGATAAHLGFESSGPEELLERMELVQREVVRLLG